MKGYIVLACVLGVIISNFNSLNASHWELWKQLIIFVVSYVAVLGVIWLWDPLGCGSIPEDVFDMEHPPETPRYSDEEMANLVKKSKDLDDFINKL